MNNADQSYLKTCIITAAMGLFAVVGNRLLVIVAPPVLVPWITIAISVVCIAVALILIAGLLVFWRNRNDKAGHEDVFLRLNHRRSERALTDRHSQFGLSLRRMVRAIVARNSFVVGDLVEVRSIDEIRATLDGSGRLDGLPFMPEMIPFCGRRFRVFRNVDKIYDYRKSRKLRRIRRGVLLAGSRCDGGAHGGCQAGCGFIWKEAWLKNVSEAAETPVTFGTDWKVLLAVISAPVSQCSASGKPRFVCQYTELQAASEPITDWDIRQDVRPYIWGNVTTRAFFVALMTRLFNFVQKLRGGVNYPYVPSARPLQIPLGKHEFVPGDTIRVLDINHIAATLDRNNKNRGLWFDKDMVKYCGQRSTIVTRVKRIIDVVTGEPIEMRAPCFVLDDVTATGEWLRLCPQNEFIFWREVWLESEITIAVRPLDQSRTESTMLVVPAEVSKGFGERKVIQQANPNSKPESNLPT